jgi:hypothetical protein
MNTIKIEQIVNKKSKCPSGIRTLIIRVKF